MSTPPHPPAASAAAEPPTRPRRWRRWLLWGLGVLVALGLGITAAALAVMFPSRDSLQWPVLPPADYAYASQSRRVVARLLDEPARLVHTAGAGAPAPLSGFDYARHSPYLPQDRQAAQRVFSVAAGEVLLEESLAGVAHASSVYEGRYALHLPAGEATRWPLAQVPAGSTLSLGVAGLPPHRDVTLCPVEITVTVQGAAGATDHPLGRLGESPQDFGWRDHELPLPAGATAVTFTAKAAAGCDGPGHAFLADPTVWAPRQGPAPINVLYINVCTWRADDLGPEARGATPKLDALAATGRRFTQARSNANWSKASQISALTGRYASTLGLKHHRVPVGQLEGLSYAHSQWPTLASVLRGAGYETAALVDNIFLADFLRVGVDLGFARFVDNARHIHNTVDLMREAVAWLTAHGDRPFFLYLNPANPHFRYRPPREYLGQIGFGWADLTGDLQHALHLGEVAYTDDAVGELLEAVRRLGLAERTLVVMHGDHGETLSWARDLEVKVPAAHKARESMIYKTTRYKHGWSWQETEIRIPLLFARPGAVPPAVDDRPASPIDVAPTILAHLGLPKPPTMPGRDLFRAGPTAPIVVDGKGFDAVVDGPLKLVRFWPGYGWWRRKHTGEVSDSPVLLFDLAADPEERHDLAAQRPADVARLTALLEQTRAQPAPLHLVRFTGPVGQQITGRVTVPGGLRTATLHDHAPTDTVTRDGEAADFTLTLGEGPVTLAFAGWTPAPPQLRLDGPVGLRVGPHALPLLAPALDGAYTGEPAALAIGADQWPDVLPAERPTAHWWSQRLDHTGPEPWRLRSLEADVMDAMRDWGYAQ